MRIYEEKSIVNFEFWSGARSTVELLTDDEMLQIESILDEQYPDGIDDTTLNDIFWFDTDFIAECLGYSDFEELYQDRKDRFRGRC